MMIFVKSSGRGFPAAVVVFCRLEGLEDLVGRPDYTVKGRLEGFQLLIAAPSRDVSKRVISVSYTHLLSPFGERLFL